MGVRGFRGTDPLSGTDDLVRQMASKGSGLEAPGNLDPLLERIGEARYVLLGEASHGTSEYYTWRARLTRRLIEEKRFRFVAVEGDWPDCYRINRYIKHRPDAGTSAFEVLHAFRRWPTWMWANREVQDLVEWMRKRNADHPDSEKVGFYGLDVYSLWESLEAIVGYLERVDGRAAEMARQAWRCFEPYEENAESYAWTTAMSPHTCEGDVVRLLSELRRSGPAWDGDGDEARFNAEQNALVAKNAEEYYRSMIRSGPDSWNIRDRHMVETLERLMVHHGETAKAVVWEHNTHVGDARYTDMASAGMENVGSLVRQAHPEPDVVTVGFGSDRGSVIAGSSWGAPMERMRVPAAQPGSWEDVLHRASGDNRVFVFTPSDREGAMAEWRGHRAIGVVYDPDRERAGNYVPTRLPLRYDAFMYIDETHALRPLHLEPDLTELPETFPTGV